MPPAAVVSDAPIPKAPAAKRRRTLRRMFTESVSEDEGTATALEQLVLCIRTASSAGRIWTEDPTVSTTVWFWTKQVVETVELDASRGGQCPVVAAIRQPFARELVRILMRSRCWEALPHFSDFFSRLRCSGWVFPDTASALEQMATWALDQDSTELALDTCDLSTRMKIFSSAIYQDFIEQRAGCLWKAALGAGSEERVARLRQLASTCSSLKDAPMTQKVEWALTAFSPDLSAAARAGFILEAGDSEERLNIVLEFKRQANDTPVWEALQLLRRGVEDKPSLLALDYGDWTALVASLDDWRADWRTLPFVKVPYIVMLGDFARALRAGVDDVADSMWVESLIQAATGARLGFDAWVVMACFLHDVMPADKLQLASKELRKLFGTDAHSPDWVVDTHNAYRLYKEALAKKQADAKAHLDRMAQKALEDAVLPSAAAPVKDEVREAAPAAAAAAPEPAAASALGAAFQLADVVKITSMQKGTSEPANYIGWHGTVTGVLKHHCKVEVNGGPCAGKTVKVLQKHLELVEPSLLRDQGSIGAGDTKSGTSAPSSSSASGAVAALPGAGPNVSKVLTSLQKKKPQAAAAAVARLYPAGDAPSSDDEPLSQPAA